MTIDNKDAVLYSAFVRAQRKFAPALKTSTNEFFSKGNKVSRYADLASCIEAVIDALHSEGFALTQFTEPEEHGIKVKTVLLHESGDLLVMGELFMPATKSDPQGFGSALTYCRRYSLLASMGIAPEDDDGNAASKPVAKVSATGGEFEKLPAHRQSVIVDVVEAIKERMTAEDIVGAYEEYSGITDNDEKIALWSKLDSKIRSAIKKHGETLKGQT